MTEKKSTVSEGLVANQHLNTGHDERMQWLENHEIPLAESDDLAPLAEP